MIKNILFLLIFCFSASAFAGGDAQVKLEGLFTFQAGMRNQSNLKGTDKYLTNNQKNGALWTDANISATLTKQDNEIIYGGKLVMLPSTKLKGSSSCNGSYLFLETAEYGRVEAGSPHDAGSKMRITGDNVSAGSGGSTGNWSRYVKLNGQGMRYYGPTANGSNISAGVAPNFVDYSQYYLGEYKTNLGQSHDKAEPPRKVNYFTPMLNGFQLGISYVPDSSNLGGTGIKEDTLKSTSGFQTVKLGKGENNSTRGFIINQNVKDAISLGLAYNYNIADGVDLKVAATGEYGKAAGKVKEVEMQFKDGKENIKLLNEHKLSDLKTYNFGGVLSYGNFNYGLSYGTLGKSLTSKEYNKTGRRTDYYNGAVAYKQGPIKTSLSGFKAYKYKNTVDAVALSTEYKVAPGLTSYAEIACFKAQGKPTHYPEAEKKKTKGTVGLIGTKLKF